MTAVRVGCNLLWLAPGQVGGSEEYCVRLLDAFARRADRYPDVEVRLLVNRRFSRAFPELSARLPLDVAPLEGERRSGRVLAEHTWLPAVCRRRRIQVVHHLGGTAPFVGTIPGIVLVHDLQPWVMPDNFAWVKRRYLMATVPRSVRRARAVTTLSPWVQRDVSSRLGVPLDRIAVVAPGASSPPPLPEDRVTEVMAKYDLVGGRYFLYPAITYPHKNHVRLVEAFARVAADHPDSVLVLTGGAASSEPDVRRAIAEHDLARLIRRPGRIPASDLDVLYRRATALTLPSRYEGFGMPVLEAMSRGCPVIASTSGALPEVVDEGGRLLPADDVGEWARAMDALLTSPAERKRWADAASLRARSFRWDDAVDALARVYRSVLPTTGSRPQ